jgi:hypothetical protein
MKQRKRTGNGELVFNPKRKLRAWEGQPADKAYGTALAAKLRYTGSPAHKRNPGDFNLSPPSAPRQNATLCDDAGIFKRVEAKNLLKAGAKKGLVDARSEGDYPLLIWAVREDGVVFEAELENSGRGEYHGYPMPLSDPLRSVILKASQAR